MSCSSDLDFIQLHDRPELYTDAAALLDTAWPRSYAARLVTFERSKDTLPCVYAYVRSNKKDAGVEKVDSIARGTNPGVLEANLKAVREADANDGVKVVKSTNGLVDTPSIERDHKEKITAGKTLPDNPQTDFRAVDICSTIEHAQLESTDSSEMRVVALAQVCFPHKPGQVVVQSVIVHPALRGQGLGAKLLESVEKVLYSRNNVTRVHLSSTDKVGFYKRCGYKVVGLRMCMCQSEMVCSCEGRESDSPTGECSETTAAFICSTDAADDSLTHILADTKIADSDEPLKKSPFSCLKGEPRHIVQLTKPSVCATGTSEFVDPGAGEQPALPLPPLPPPPPPPMAQKKTADSTKLPQIWLSKTLQDY